MWAWFSALAVSTHYFAVFLIAPEAIWLVVGRTHRRQAILKVAAVIAVGLTRYPWR